MQARIQDLLHGQTARRLVLPTMTALFCLAGTAGAAAQTPGAAGSSSNQTPPTFSKDLVAASGAPVVAVQATRMTTGLNRPWSLAWLPGGEMLVTERGGTLRRIGADFKLDPKPIEGCRR